MFARRSTSNPDLLPAWEMTTLPLLLDFRNDVAQGHARKPLVSLGGVVAIPGCVLTDKSHSIDYPDLSVQNPECLDGYLRQRPCLSYHRSSSSINSMGETTRVLRPTTALTFFSNLVITCAKVVRPGLFCRCHMQCIQRPDSRSHESPRMFLHPFIQPDKRSCR